MFYKSKILLFVVIILTSFASWVSAQGLLLAPAKDVKVEEAKENNKAQEAKKSEPKLLDGKVVDSSKPVLMPAKKPVAKVAPKAAPQPTKKNVLKDASFDELPNELGLDEPEIKEEVDVVKNKPAKKEYISNIVEDKVEDDVTMTINPLIAAEIDADNEIFSKMSEIEKEAALLTLQLKKEKIQNDIQAVKKQRQAAIDDEIERKEEIAEKRRLAIQEEQRKMLVEQQKLKDKEIAFEKLRQEKLVDSYKEQMLLEKQEWISKNKEFYEKFDEIKKSNNRIVEDAKTKINNLTSTIETLNAKAVEVKKENDIEIADLKTQVSILKAQLDAQNPQNPFDQSGKEVIVDKLENFYAVVEVRGKGNKLIAKLMNKNGKTMLAQIGTELKTGHVVDEITDTHLRADRNGVKDFVYFITPDFLSEEGELSSVGSAVRDAVAPSAVSPGRSLSVYAP